MLFWEALASVLIGLVIAYGALHRLPRRLPARRLVLSTGPAAALLGALLTHTVLGSGHAAAVLIVALGFAAALLSLLIRPTRTRRRRSVPA
ncbi:hypothetical protein VT50_0218520 [Streptomyces antioxidans]|uniref:Integral membrane protein n=1 Tax=Streptomyces antioxidans TaxID=1507734 RepID=A0A1V4D3L1_9ACTN|nr:hypothetical protein [Streptomyces antioxidans]OPF78746.1 hypothetical protein VT50_0218520 [Streptomyces antioxidans]